MPTSANHDDMELQPMNQENFADSDVTENDITPQILDGMYQPGLVGQVKKYVDRIAVPRSELRRNVATSRNKSIKEKRTMSDGSVDVVDGTGYDMYPKDRKYYIPVFLIVISIAELVAFGIHSAHMKAEHCIEVDSAGPAPICSRLIYNPYRRQEAWRLITYLLTHSGYVHIASNIFVQIFLGLWLEIAHGPLAIGAIYMAGVISGGLASTISDPWSYLCGASGGVYALIIAYLPTLILNFRETKTILEWLISVFVLLVAAIDVVFAIWSRYFSSAAGLNDTPVAYAAHLGGGVAGFLIGMNVLKNIKSERWEKWLRLACFLVWSLGIIVAILINAFGGDAIYPPPDFSPIANCSYRNEC